MNNGARYTNEQLRSMSYAELCDVSPDEMAEHPPIRGLGFPAYVCYSCRFCGKSLEGSERTVNEPSRAKPVICPHCGEMLWDPNGKNCLRKTAFLPGHFDLERRKRYLKDLKDRAKRQENI